MDFNYLTWWASSCEFGSYPCPKAWGSLVEGHGLHGGYPAMCISVANSFLLFDSCACSRGSSRLVVATAWLESIGPPKWTYHYQIWPIFQSLSWPNNWALAMLDVYIRYMLPYVTTICCCLELFQPKLKQAGTALFSYGQQTHVTTTTSQVALGTLTTTLWTGDEWKEVVEVFLLILIFCLAQPTTWIHAVCWVTTQPVNASHCLLTLAVMNR